MGSTSSVMYTGAAGPLRIRVFPLNFPPAPVTERVAHDPWLARQHHLFNVAYKIDDAANAIRLLFLIWEALDMSIGVQMRGFRYVRDFVSHARITKAKTVAFIQAHLGAGTDQYDPFSRQHCDFLSEWWRRAEEATRPEPEQRLAGGPRSRRPARHGRVPK
jgi:hypothetical protein